MTASKGDVDVPAEFNLEFPEDILALAEQFYNEWCNGGFSQLFANWYPADVQLIPEALKAIGASEAASTVDAACTLMGPPDQWRDKGHKALIDRSDALGDRLWTLNRQIDERALRTLIEEYELKLSEAGNDSGSQDKQ